MKNVVIQPEFIEFQTKDGLNLPGLLYKAEKGRDVAICLHGNGSSSVFYTEKRNQSFASTLAEKDISTLYFNNRGVGIIKKIYVRHGKKEEKKWFGMAYEKIKECVEDID
ncbi:MAG: hypothetical protein ABIC36_01365 [bacterium]